MTEDSYSGEETDPLSQNLYSYVQNNPVNYTDPSGHFWKKLVQGAKKTWNNVKKVASNTWNTVKRVATNTWNSATRIVTNTWNTVKRTASNVWNQVTTFATNIWNTVKNVANTAWNFVTKTAQTAYNMAYNFYQGASNFVVQQYNSAKRMVTNAWEQAKATGKSVYNWGVSKSKEALNIGRNWTKALEETVRHVCEVATRVNGGKVLTPTVKFDPNQTTVAKDFKQNLQNQYGFDPQTADIMWKLYQNIKNKEGQNADYIFNRLMGGAQYDNIFWQQTAGNMGEIKSQLSKYGISGSQADELVYNIKIQYFLSSGTYGDINSLKKKGLYDAFKSTANKVYPGIDFDQLWNNNYKKYSGKTDFAHQSITTATHLNKKPSLANVYGSFLGGIEQLAGWRGDVTKDAFAKPSMGNDDYRADLDTVNITSIMKKNNTDYISASNLYYDGISSGVYTRANAFKQNIGLDYVKKAIYASLVPKIDLGTGIRSQVARTDAQSMEYLKQKYPDSYNFIRNLEAGNNEFKDYTKVP